ncbi:MAG: pantoate--beta-alanine ligase [Oligoflexia bacterium]|nr:pantoate--beta-alanine ligase [Oligoflexia bacterium]
MKIFRTKSETRAQLASLAGRGNTVGLVPTMGNLHEGHISLVKRARQDCDIIAASIFVNPSQFAPSEDYNAYPRTPDADIKKLEENGCDVLFNPDEKEMYDEEYSNTVVDETVLSKTLCGRFRENHFRGVLTVVLKLFNICMPHCAYFGMKDYQQYLLIREMVRKMDMNINVVPCPTVREKNGLAMSSRNSYMDSGQEETAPLIYKSLTEIKKAYDSGISDVATLKGIGMGILIPGLKLQYLEFADSGTLQKTEEAKTGTLVAIAAYCGKTRLIDNIIL